MFSGAGVLARQRPPPEKGTFYFSLAEGEKWNVPFSFAPRESNTHSAQKLAGTVMHPMFSLDEVGGFR